MDAYMYHPCACCFLSESVASTPNITSLKQLSPTAVRVQWSQPSGGATVTGYVVHYSDSGTERSKNVTASGTSSDITNLTDGPTYMITVEVTSKHLSGESDDKTITLSKTTFFCPYSRLVCVLLHRSCSRWCYSKKYTVALNPNLLEYSRGC